MHGGNGGDGLELLPRGKSLPGSVIDPDSLCSPILEVAYWIGRQPGVDDPDTAIITQYIDTRPWSRSFPDMRDRFVVFHFHSMNHVIHFSNTTVTPSSVS
jgi:hypothetical protein